MIHGTTDFAKEHKKDTLMFLCKFVSSVVHNIKFKKSKLNIKTL